MENRTRVGDLAQGEYDLMLNLKKSRWEERVRGKVVIIEQGKHLLSSKPRDPNNPEKGRIWRSWGSGTLVVKIFEGGGKERITA